MDSFRHKHRAFRRMVASPLGPRAMVVSRPFSGFYRFLAGVHRRRSRCRGYSFAIPSFARTVDRITRPADLANPGDGNARVRLPPMWSGESWAGTYVQGHHGVGYPAASSILSSQSVMDVELAHGS